MPSWPIHLLAGLVAGLGAALAPGARLVLTIRGAAEEGSLARMRAALGGAGADLLAISGIGLVSAVRPDLLGSISIVLGFLAAAVLVARGFLLMSIGSGGILHRDRGGELVGARNGNPALDGFLVAIRSPGWHLFWWTAGLWLVLRAAGSGVLEVVVFAGGFLVSGVAWHVFVGARLQSPGRDCALSDRQFRIVSSLAGLFLVGLGLAAAAAVTREWGIGTDLERIVGSLFG